MGFHLLYPAKRPDLKVDVVMGGIATNTISHRAFKGRQQAGIAGGFMWILTCFCAFETSWRWVSFLRKAVLHG